MSNNPGTAIVLCGGDINHTNLPIGTNASNAMVPVNGKPVIGWIADDLLAKGIERLVVVLQEKNTRLAQFTTWAYGSRLHLELAFVQGRTIVHSLMAGLQKAPQNGPVHIILGDTLITDAYGGTQDFVYTGTVPDPRNWCLVQAAPSGQVQAYFDKVPPAQLPPGTTLPALTGYYYLTQTAHLKHCTQQALEQQHKELSQVLQAYQQQQPIHARAVQNWLDFGHTDGLLHAKRQLLKGRHFNSLQIDPSLGIMVKNSTNQAKLQHELDWYRLLPGHLKVLAPRLLESTQSNGQVQIVQEYYGYPNLAELFLFADLSVDIWHSVVDNLLNLHQHLASHQQPLPQEHLHQMYQHKTLQRLEQLVQEQPQWATLLLQPTLTLNGQELLNWPQLKAWLTQQALPGLWQQSTATIMHGDYCFSNILYDVNNHIIRLIDPRGSFGPPGIYGDPRYDLAKLRHSTHGCYDFIIADLFKVQQPQPGHFSLNIYTHPTQQEVARYLDQKLPQIGQQLAHITLIEALLFISMVPLHKDKPQRQYAMYLTGIRYLNQLYNESSSRS